MKTGLWIGAGVLLVVIVLLFVFRKKQQQPSTRGDTGFYLPGTTTTDGKASVNDYLVSSSSLIDSLSGLITSLKKDQTTTNEKVATTAITTPLTQEQKDALNAGIIGVKI